jgi:hypothetical protein
MYTILEWSPLCEGLPKYSTRVEVNGNDKHYSTVQSRIIYGYKKFYIIAYMSRTPYGRILKT